MHGTFTSVFVLLLFVLDPFASMPVVAGLLAPVPPARRVPVIARECAFAAGLLLVGLVSGHGVLDLFGLSDASVDISGGVVLLIIGIRMLFPAPSGIFGEMPGGEPYLVPLATPLIAGPGALATVLLLASRYPGQLTVLAAAVLAAVAVSFVLLVLSERIARRLGGGMLSAIERLMGILLAAMAVEMFLRGVTVYLRQLPH